VVTGPIELDCEVTHDAEMRSERNWLLCNSFRRLKPSRVVQDFIMFVKDDQHNLLEFDTGENPRRTTRKVVPVSVPFLAHRNVS
jgi:hypothetical protein